MKLKHVFLLTFLTIHILSSCKKDLESTKMYTSPILLLSNNSVSCWDSVFITLSSGAKDISKFGFYHNELMSGGLGSNLPEDSCDYVNIVIDTINSRILNFENSDIDNYYTEESMSCSDFIENTKQRFKISGQELLDSLKSDIEDGLSLVYSYGQLNSQEYQLLLDFVDSVYSGNQITPCQIKSDWNQISNKIDNGAFSGTALSIGLYSNNYWTNDSEDNPAAWVLADYGGFVWGYATYMVRNWDEHYDPQFGLNALKEGAWSASGSSLLRKWW
jgi:hypothetical protein